MNKVKNRKTGEIGIVQFGENTNGAVAIVFAPPKKDFEVAGRVIARYRTRKGLWQRWETLR